MAETKDEQPKKKPRYRAKVDTTYVSPEEKKRQLMEQLEKLSEGWGYILGGEEEGGKT